MSANLARSDDRRFGYRDDNTIRIFDVFPGRRYVEDLLRHVREDGRPDLWRWHLNTSPPPGSRFEIVAEDVTIPESLRARVGMAPCPLCSPNRGKYYHGMLAWFPDEHAVRVIGNECAKRIAGADSLRDARARKAEREADSRALSFLIDNLPSVRAALSGLESILPRARRIDVMTNDLRRSLKEPTRQRLLRENSDHGGLPLYEKVMVPILDRRGRPVLDRKGDILRQEDEIVASVVEVHGLDILGRPHLCESYAKRAADALAGLGIADDDQAWALINGLGPAGRIEAEKRMREAWKLIDFAFSLFGRLVVFCEADNINRLGSWGSDSRAPLRLNAFSSAAGRIDIGEAGRKAVSIFPRRELLDPLPAIPDLV